LRSSRILLAILIFAGARADAGIFSRNKTKAEEVPGGHPPNLVAPNGVVVPAWASKRMRESPVPLQGKSWGRRPWALPLSNQSTPSAVWARADQLGFGVGPVTGYSNDYGGAGNYPMAHVGKDDVNGWAPGPNPNRLFMPRFYPFNTGTPGF
jgi:hypothetical protein